MTCKSDNQPPDSDENQATGPVLTVTFSCQNDGTSSTSNIVLKGLEILDENKQPVNVFNEALPIVIECIGGVNDKDGDGCKHEEEVALNVLSQELAGIDFMNPNVFDWPDAKEITPDIISIGDVLA